MLDKTERIHVAHEKKTQCFEFPPVVHQFQHIKGRAYAPSIVPSSAWVLLSQVVAHLVSELYMNDVGAVDNITKTRIASWI
jgi:hypothetical protein